MVTIIIAQALGIMFFVLGLSIIITKKGMMSLIHEIEQDPAFLWLLGCLVLGMGALIVVANGATFNLAYSSNTAIFVALIGWLTLIKGAVILLFPTWTISVYKKLNNKNMILRLGGFGTLILGVILLYIGFM